MVAEGPAVGVELVVDGVGGALQRCLEPSQLTVGGEGEAFVVGPFGQLVQHVREQWQRFGRVGCGDVAGELGHQVDDQVGVDAQPGPGGRLDDAVGGAGQCERPDDQRFVLQPGQQGGHGGGVVEEVGPHPHDHCRGVVCEQLFDRGDHVAECCASCSDEQFLELVDDHDMPGARCAGRSSRIEQFGELGGQVVGGCEVVDVGARASLQCGDDAGAQDRGLSGAGRSDHHDRVAAWPVGEVPVDGAHRLVDCGGSPVEQFGVVFGERFEPPVGVAGAGGGLGA